MTIYRYPNDLTVVTVKNCIYKRRGDKFGIIIPVKEHNGSNVRAIRYNSDYPNPANMEVHDSRIGCWVIDNDPRIIEIYKVLDTL